MLAVLTTLIVLALAWPVARAAAQAPGRLAKWLDAVGAVPYCLPGMVVDYVIERQKSTLHSLDTGKNGYSPGMPAYMQVQDAWIMIKV